jgi:hypothetical protein
VVRGVKQFWMGQDQPDRIYLGILSFYTGNPRLYLSQVSGSQLSTGSIQGPPNSAAALY